MPAELRRSLPLGAVPEGGRDERIVADAAECAALAERFGIPAIGRLEATLRLTPAPAGRVVAAGTLRADVTQVCVITLEPFDQSVEAEFRWCFLPPGEAPADGPDDADDIPTDGHAELGEALAEELSLCLDPYPRAPGATLPTHGADPPTGPFAKLLPLRPPR